MITELFPDAKNVGIIYCSGEPNSVYQADVVKAALEKAGCTVTIYTFADTNDVVSVTGTASDANDVLYVPTDNTAAPAPRPSRALPRSPSSPARRASARAAALRRCPSTTTSSAAPPARWP